MPLRNCKKLKNKKNPACRILRLRRVAFATLFNSAAVRSLWSIFLCNRNEVSYYTKRHLPARRCLSHSGNAGDRNRTGTMSPPQDFKSCASASSATPACNKIANGQRWIRTTEANCSRFTVCPLWPLGNLPIHV